MYNILYILYIIYNIYIHIYNIYSIYSIYSIICSIIYSKIYIILLALSEGGSRGNIES